MQYSYFNINNKRRCVIYIYCFFVVFIGVFCIRRGFIQTGQSCACTKKIGQESAYVVMILKPNKFLSDFCLFLRLQLFSLSGWRTRALIIWSRTLWSFKNILFRKQTLQRAAEASRKLLLLAPFYSKWITYSLCILSCIALYSCFAKTHVRLLYLRRCVVL